MPNNDGTTILHAEGRSDTNVPADAGTIELPNINTRNDETTNNMQAEGTTHTDAAPVNAEPTEQAESNDISISSIFYVMEAFKATASPVTITMILSALATNFIQTDESSASREATLTASYSAITVEEDASSSEQIAIGLVNGMVIIAVLTAMTFGVVFLYKYRCLWVLKGYLLVSITFLLAYFGGIMFYEAIQRYHLWVDKISFALVLFNFTVGGIYSLFFGKGVPVYVGQGYLIAISVILAWELSHFNEIAAWVLLVLLALYDLYAVLTPCGPLKALVNLMKQDGAQNIPALLYEARLPPEAQRQQPGAQQRRQQRQAPPPRQSDDPPVVTGAPQSPQSATTQNAGMIQSTTTQNGSQPNRNDDDQNCVVASEIEMGAINSNVSEPITSDEPAGGEEKKSEGDSVVAALDTPQLHPSDPPPAESNSIGQENMANPEVLAQSPREEVVIRSEDEFEMIPNLTGTIPMAIAKQYKLPLVDGTSTDGDFTAEQLKALVQVYYPRNGGRIEQLPSPPRPETNNTSRSRFGLRRNRREPEEPEVIQYNVIDRNGGIKRTIFVGVDGKVYRVLNEEEQTEQEKTQPGSIRLGLVSSAHRAKLLGTVHASYSNTVCQLEKIATG